MKNKLSRKLVKKYSNFIALAELLVLAVIVVVTFSGLMTGSLLLKVDNDALKLSGGLLYLLTGFFYIYSRGTLHIRSGLILGDKMFKFFQPRVYNFGHGWIF